jgi:hypothetical protein
MPFSIVLKNNSLISNSDLLSGGSLYIPSNNIFTISPDLQTLYVASPLGQYITKYNQTSTGWVDSNTIVPNSFNVRIGSLFPSGLYVYKSFLFITFADNNNNSQIWKVDATTGNQFYSSTTGYNMSSIYSTNNAGLTSMISDDTYLYVSNTGNLNRGHTIVRVKLEDNTVDENWVSFTYEISSPIQLQIFGGFLAVLHTSLLNNYIKHISLIKLEDGTYTTLSLPGSEYTKLGLSLNNSGLNIINENNNSMYTVDLTVVNQIFVVTTVSKPL